MMDYIPTPEPVHEERSTLPEGRALTLDQAQALRWAYPSAALMQVGDVMYLTAWNLPTPQPTDAELEAALPAALAHAKAQRELSEVQAMLDERYRMYTRALATGNGGAASEIQAEITDILAYLKELRDASRSA